MNEGSIQAGRMYIHADRDTAYRETMTMFIVSRALAHTDDMTHKTRLPSIAATIHQGIYHK
jgi:hypothetical protein